MFHKDVSDGDVHKPSNWQYSDATARLTATGFVSGDVGKWAWQLSDNTYWVLTATTPTWVQVGGGGGGGGTVSGSVTPFIFVPPILSNWAWANQNAGTNGTSTRGFYIKDTPHTGWNLAAMHKAAPVAPYTAEFAIQPSVYVGDNNLFGVGWYNSSSGKYSLWEYYMNAGIPSITGNEFTNSTTQSTAFGTGLSRAWDTQSIVYIRIDFDGANFRQLISQTGEYWYPLGTVANTSSIGLVPDICICASANSNTFPVNIELLHYKTYTSINPPSNV